MESLVKHIETFEVSEEDVKTKELLDKLLRIAKSTLKKHLDEQREKKRGRPSKLNLPSHDRRLYGRLYYRQNADKIKGKLRKSYHENEEHTAKILEEKRLRYNLKSEVDRLAKIDENIFSDL